MNEQHQRGRQVPPPAAPIPQVSTPAPGPHTWRPAFLASLALTGNVSEAARAASIDRTTAYAARETDEAFAAAWTGAIDEATDHLEAEARRRAVDGVTEPVFYQGVQCGVVRRYSDGLLQTLLKAHRPEKYRDRSAVELTGKGGGPVETAAQVLIYLPSNGRDDNDPATAGTTGDLASEPR